MKPDNLVKAAKEAAFFLSFLCLLHAINFKVFNINKYKEDLDHGCDLPMWILLGGQISQVLMITNSSINFFIYCFMSSIFR